MRHKKNFNHLGRKSAHRKAMLANMAASLIMHKRIKTTTAKAKALRSYVEPLITKSKEDSTHSRRVVFSYLQNKYAVSELFREVATKVAERPGGYTRILKMENRLGDNAEICVIELVDYNENMLKATEEEKEKTDKKRTRRSRRKSGDTTQKTESTAAQTVEGAEKKANEEPKDETKPVEKVNEEQPKQEEQKTAEKEEVQDENEQVKAEDKAIKEEKSDKKAEDKEEKKAEVKNEDKAEEKEEKPKGDDSQGKNENKEDTEKE
jgi:large subunit ribosomal protein L17